ncbi:hypothetical protein Tco_0653194 [Tanacetum coccineum]|uniref:Integrase, catalytic region, zinc finger, CCHC-type, peptidase aspartic, catalytic n=1 Tax=Tanacetum coccineum TaxID=301880 RepID=A0ABQ4WZW4_9ASTR
MSRMQEDIQCAGSDTRPPMLDRIDFESWQQRIRLYCLGKDNGENIMKSIKEGPFQMGTVLDVVTGGTEGAVQQGPVRARVLNDLSAEEKEVIKLTFVQPTSYSGYPKDILLTHQSLYDAKDIWDNWYGLLEATMRCHVYENRNYDGMVVGQPKFKDDLLEVFTEKPWIVKFNPNSLALTQSLQLTSSQQNNQLLEGRQMQGTCYCSGQGSCGFKDEDRTEEALSILVKRNPNKCLPLYWIGHIDETVQGQGLQFRLLQGQAAIMQPRKVYMEDNEDHVVQRDVSSVRNDALMSILDEMHEQGVQSRLANKSHMVVNDSVTSELARYKELVGEYEKRAAMFEFKLHGMCVVNILNSVNANPTVRIVLNKEKQIWKPKGKLSDNSLNKTKAVWKPKGNMSDNSPQQKLGNKFQNSPNSTGFQMQARTGHAFGIWTLPVKHGKKQGSSPTGQNLNSYMEVLHYPSHGLCGPMRVQSIKGEEIHLSHRGGLTIQDSRGVKFLSQRMKTPEFVHKLS